MAHREKHHTHRVAWLRAAVLGANDGIVSTASLLIGIAAANAPRGSIMLAGAAGLVAGAMSMAAGEYVSVHSQADTEKADLEKEEKELIRSPVHELQELTDIYIDRGLSSDLALQVAVELTEHDALAAHARDELGITEISAARPLQAAGFSAVSFAVGAALPLAAAYLSPTQRMIQVVAISSLLFLCSLGALAARAGGANIFVGAGRVLFWSSAAMAATFVVGWAFGTSVA
jgi:VIT1/CCC1 family predicted Fe2+/Mn2+ transporter